MIQSIFSHPSLKKQINEMKSPEAKASEMEHAIRHEIRVKLEENPVYYSSLRERLEELIQARKDKQMSISDFAVNLQDIIDDMRSTAEKGAKLGLSREQYPFYQQLEDLLPEDEDKESLKELTELITEIVQDHAVVEWTHKEDVKRQMRRKVKKQLRASRCPKDQVEGVAGRLMELAEVHYRR